MRRALDGNPPISTYFAEPGYGYFGKHAGYDYAVVRWAVRAPEAGTIINVWTGRETVDGGNIVELRSANYDHRFLHLQSASVKVGQVVSEGQELGITGNTGNVGFHLHHDVRKKGTAWTDSFSNYVDWEQLLKSAPSAGGSNMFQTDQEVQEAYLLLRGNAGTAAERAGWIGQSKQRFFQVAKPEADATRTALANAQKQVSALNTQVSTLTTKTTALETQVKSLTAQITTLTAQIKTLTDTIASKDKEIADLKSQVATGGSSEDTQLLNGFGEALRKLIARLGTK